MKVLMTTEKLDNQDSIFAFSHLWVRTIAEQVEHLTVLALSVGDYDLPANVTVYSLGKEKYKNKNKFLKNFLYTWNFYKTIFKERKNYSHVFVHMNQQYVIMGGPLWKLWSKKIGLWYTHRHVSKSLRLAVSLADVVFTAAEESMNIKTHKKKVLGHGVLTDSFVNPNRKKVFSEDKKVITSIGRITPIKDLGTLIRASKILIDQNINLEVRLIGPEVNDNDKKYREVLDELIKSLNLENKIIFTGGKNPQETKQELWQGDMHVNLCPTGGLDKAVIESACAGVHSLAANQAFRVHFGDLADDYLFEHGNAEMLAGKIEAILSSPQDISERKLASIQNSFRAKFDIKTLITNMLKLLS